MRIQQHLDVRDYLGSLYQSVLTTSTKLAYNLKLTHCRLAFLLIVKVKRA